MNCSPVTVVGTSTAFTGPRIFEANIFGQGTCNTVEGVDVVYPNPGPSVALGGAFKNGNTGPPTVLANCPFDQNVNLSTNGGGPVSAGNSTANVPVAPTIVAAGSAPSATAAVQVPAPATGIPSVQTSVATPDAPSDPTTSDPAASDPATSDPTASDPATSDPATSDPSTPATAQTPGTNTTGTGPSGAGPTGSCTDNGSIHCSTDGNYFSMCSNNQLVNMGSVALGTSCVSGNIVKHKRALPPQLFRRKHVWTF